MAKKFYIATVATPSIREDRVQELVVQLLRNKYKDVIFQANYLSGIKLTKGVAVKAKRLGHEKSMPDIMIFEPSQGYHGLHLELKATDINVYKKESNDYTSKHLGEQADKMYLLNKNGYLALFSNKYEDAEKIIHYYMGTKSSERMYLNNLQKEFMERHEAIRAKK